jgi:hypothetical protein
MEILRSCQKEMAMLHIMPCNKYSAWYCAFLALSGWFKVPISLHKLVINQINRVVLGDLCNGVGVRVQTRAQARTSGRPLVSI